MVPSDVPSVLPIKNSTKAQGEVGATEIVEKKSPSPVDLEDLTPQQISVIFSHYCTRPEFINFWVKKTITGSRIKNAFVKKNGRVDFGSDYTAELTTILSGDSFSLDDLRDLIFIFASDGVPSTKLQPVSMNLIINFRTCIT